MWLLVKGVNVPVVGQIKLSWVVSFWDQWSILKRGELDGFPFDERRRERKGKWWMFPWGFRGRRQGELLFGMVHVTHAGLIEQGVGKDPSKMESLLYSVRGKEMYQKSLEPINAANIIITWVTFQHTVYLIEHQLLLFFLKIGFNWKTKPV